MPFTDFAPQAAPPASTAAHAARCSRMRGWLLAACLLLCCALARTASAQPAPASLGFYVDPALLSPSALQAALEAELGFPLQPLAAPDASRATLRVEALGADQVRITLEGGDGR